MFLCQPFNSTVMHENSHRKYANECAAVSNKTLFTNACGRLSLACRKQMANPCLISQCRCLKDLSILSIYFVFYCLHVLVIKAKCVIQIPQECGLFVHTIRPATETSRGHSYAFGELRMDSIVGVVEEDQLWQIFFSHYLSCPFTFLTVLYET